MSTTSKAAKPAATPKAAANTKENMVRGTLLALTAIPVGVTLWVILWRMGFIASLVAFAITWLAVKLYGWGAGVITRRSTGIIVAISVLGVLLAFTGGIVSDLVQFASEDAKMTEWEIITDSQFARYIWDNLTYPALWSEYKGDLAISALFAGLGMFFTLKDLFISTRK